MTILEIAIGVALLGLIAASAIAALTVLNKNAASTRVMSNAREIVQSSIEQAIGVPWPQPSPPEEPEILAKGNKQQEVAIYKSRDWDDATDKGSLKVTGTLESTVTEEASMSSIRRVNFRLSYTLFKRPMSYEMTTIRARDK